MSVCLLACLRHLRIPIQSQSHASRCLTLHLSMGLENFRFQLPQRSFRAVQKGHAADGRSESQPAQSFERYQRRIVPKPFEVLRHGAAKDSGDPFSRCDCQCDTMAAPSHHMKNRRAAAHASDRRDAVCDIANVGASDWKECDFPNPIL